MGFWGHGGARRLAIGTVIVAALLLAYCGALSLMPLAGDDNAGFQSYGEFAAAYDRVAAGRTPASQLGRLGFDIAASGTQTLSYLGAVERFMPRDSRGFDALDPAMRACLEATDRCTGYIFHLAGWREAQAGGGMMSLFDEARAATVKRPAAQVILLIQDGRVAYKAISGFAPEIEVAQNKK